MDDPVPTYLDDEYRFLWTSSGVELIFERIGPNRDGQLRAYVTPSEALTDRFLPGDTVTIDSARSLRTYANTLEKSVDSINWFDHLAIAAELARQRYREGDPIVWLPNVSLDQVSRYLIRPFVFDRAITMLYGDGGSAKSVVALLMAVAVATGLEVAGCHSEAQGPVIYLDWEDDDVTHAERGRAIAAGLEIEWRGLPLAYQRMSTSLHDARRELRKRVAVEGFRFAVIDSLGMATGGDPNNSGEIIRCLQAARSLGIPVLVIHHVGHQDKHRPTGSVYTTNEVRLAWRVETDQDAGSTRELATLHSVLTNWKVNRAAKAQRRGMTLWFENEITSSDDEVLRRLSVSARRVDEMPDSLARPSQKTVIEDWIELEGPKTYDELARFIGTSGDTVRKLMTRHTDTFVRLPGRPVRWALLDTHHTEPPLEGQPAFGDAWADRSDDVSDDVPSDPGEPSSPVSPVEAEPDDVEREPVYEDSRYDDI